jgi:hypothetical protein
MYNRAYIYTRITSGNYIYIYTHIIIIITLNLNNYT